MSEEAKADTLPASGAVPEERERFWEMLHRVLPLRQKDPAAWAEAKKLIRYAYRGLIRSNAPATLPRVAPGWLMPPA